MVLSRFWLVIFISSIFFIVFGLFSSQYYSIDYVLNGKKDDPILISEKFIDEIPVFIKDSIQKSKDKTYILNRDILNIDTSYVFKNQTVKIYSGKQKSDGLLPTCKTSLFDIILPLMAYLAFFCGLMELLIISGASEKLAKKLSPFFAQIFPSVPKNHESVSYMTLNFAANFLGLDSAATPFGLKAMESLQTLNPEKEKATNAQIMFLVLHTSGLTVIPLTIISYRLAAGSQDAASIFIPCVLATIGTTLASIIVVGLYQKLKWDKVSDENCLHRENRRNS